MFNTNTVPSTVFAYLAEMHLLCSISPVFRPAASNDYICVPIAVPEKPFEKSFYFTLGRSKNCLMGGPYPLSSISIPFHFQARLQPQMDIGPKGYIVPEVSLDLFLCQLPWQAVVLCGFGARA